MVLGLFTFAKPYCFRYSSILGHGRFFGLDVQRNNSRIKYFTTNCSVMAPKTALFIVAEGSEELELVAPVDILRRANVILSVI